MWRIHSQKDINGIKTSHAQQREQQLFSPQEKEDEKQFY
jgi:hypothetical protein